MADSSNLFTTHALERVQVDSVTSEATGFPIENAFDHNRDTYWKPTSTASQSVNIDLQGNYGINGIAVHVHNYSTDHDNGGIAVIGLYWATDGTYTSLTLVDSLIFANDGAPGNPIYLSAGFSSTHRYWRIYFTNMATTIEISQFFLLTQNALSIGNAYPEESVPIFATKEYVTPSGRNYVRRFNRLKFQSIYRHWSALTETQFQSLELAVNQSHEGTFPLIFNEGTDYKVVRIRRGSFRWKKILHDLYEAEIIFDEIPYIEDGQNY